MILKKYPRGASIEKRPTFMLRVTPSEALTLIQSLSSQMLAKNPNSGRAEFTTEEGEYFSIAVMEQE